MEGKAGYTKTLSELLNQLSNTVDGAFNDTIRVAEALAKGDLSQKVTTEYAGAYNQVKVSVNTTADSLTKIVGEIKNIVEAATKRRLQHQDGPERQSRVTPRPCPNCSTCCPIRSIPPSRTPSTSPRRWPRAT